MPEKPMALFYKWISLKIGVEIRCCLGLFLMLFFYCVQRLLAGTAQASIWHIAQMVAAAYFFGWLQALLHADFDRMDSLGLREWAVILGSGLVYGLVAWLCGWFAGSPLLTLLFAVYMAGCGLSTVLLCHVKRAIDARLLNDDLRAFQQRAGQPEGMEP